MKAIKPLEAYLEEMKKIEGYPIGKDKDISALSDPPHYTACPNPYLNDFIAEHGRPYDEETDDYHREPFAGDVSEGKNDPIYNAHSYHTKVPHKGIMKYIEHYTDEGDIVLDGFCGTGMTGVAAQLLNRKAILSDLSPIATFIAYNYNNPVDVDEFEKEAKRILKEVEDECGWMYETRHVEADEDIPKSLKKIKEKHPAKKGRINFTVWSDVFICPYCKEEYVFFYVAVHKGKILKQYNCPNCEANLLKRNCKRCKLQIFDKALRKEIRQAKQIPVQINYSIKIGEKNKRFEKKTDEKDLQLIQHIEDLSIPYWFPTNRLPSGYNTEQPIRSHGITHIHHFYTTANIWIMATFWDKLKSQKDRVARALMLCHTAANPTLSKMRRFRADKKGGGALPGTLYVSSLITPPNVILSVSRNFEFILNGLNELKNIGCNSMIGTNSASQLGIPTDSIDYIFTDPPFGDNLMYSELNFLWESWLKVFTNNESEAIINKSQNKSLTEYHQLMLSAFKEYYRVLKPGRWITVVFHNSKSSVWNAIQDAMSKAGFIIAHVTVLDKKQGSFKQVTAAGAVKNDLVISAYKPKTSFSERFLKSAGEDLEVEFVRQFLENLPIRPTIERTEKMLYSKMLVYYVRHGYEVRYDSKSFYPMLSENFEELDGYWFDSDQTDAYEEFKKKMRLEGIDEIRHGQSALFISDEKSALIWLHQFLDKPKSFSDISTAFNKLSNISDDVVPELSKLLEDSFVSESGKFRRPETDAEKTAVSDKREKALTKEFESLLTEVLTSKKKIKTVRKEALVSGFETCYRQNRFSDILSVAKRLNKKIIENNAELSEFVEVAQIRVEGIS